MRNRLFTSVPVLLLLCSFLNDAVADDGYIDVEIVNNSTYDQEIAVVDNICRTVVLERRIVADGRIPARVCARNMNRGDLTIRNLETGSERQYRGILNGDRVQVP
jgi:hypothetical protein